MNRAPSWKTARNWILFSGSVGIVRLLQEFGGGDAPKELVQALAQEEERLLHLLPPSNDNLPVDTSIEPALDHRSTTVVASTGEALRIYVDATLAIAGALLPHLWRHTQPALCMVIILAYSCLAFPTFQHVAHPLARRLGLGGLLLGSVAVEPAPSQNIREELADLPELVPGAGSVDDLFDPLAERADGTKKHVFDSAVGMVPRECYDTWRTAEENRFAARANQTLMRRALPRVRGPPFSSGNTIEQDGTVDGCTLAGADKKSENSNAAGKITNSAANDASNKSENYRSSGGVSNAYPKRGDDRETGVGFVSRKPPGIADGTCSPIGGLLGKDNGDHTENTDNSACD